MASLAIGSVCKPTSPRFSRVNAVKSSSSLATGSQASKFLWTCKFDKNGFVKLQQRRCSHIDQGFAERFPLNRIKKEKFEFNATSTNNPQFDATQDLMSPMENFIIFLDVLYRFIRPYAAVGTVLSVASMSLLAVEKLSDFSPLFFMKVLQALVGGMFMQMYVCGFNQICDIELDKVNKPSLPLAGGELSMTTAIVVSTLSAIMSLSTGWLVGSPPLFWGFIGWFIVGTAYSANVLPLLRWKRFPFTAALYMLMARALVVPIGYYMHMKTSITGGSISLLSRPLLFAVGMLSAFSLSTIFFKDIPDMEGDRMHGIKSLALKLGQKKIYWICIWILEIAYVGAAFVGATSPITWSKYVTIISHLAMAVLLWIRAKSVDLKNMESVQSMYMFLWQLFYAEYGLISLVR